MGYNSVSSGETTITGTSIRTTQQTAREPSVKQGFVEYDSPQAKPLTAYKTTEDEPPKIIEDCPTCETTGTVRIVLVENEPSRSHNPPEFTAVGEFCTEDNCNHSRP
jgi:hypothetical protein